MVDREDVVRAARELVPVLRERARKTEQLRRVPDETISDLRDAGLLKLLQPARYGGYEADMATFFEIVLTLSAADGSVGWVHSVLSVHTWMLSLMNPQAPDEVWGSDRSALVCSATAPRSGYIDKVAEGYRIDGRFGFSSGCHHASWAFVLGVVRNAPEDGFLSFLVPASDYEIVDNWNVMGMCGTGSCDIVVNATVPAHRVHNLAKSGSDISDASIYKVPFMKIFSHVPTVPLVGIAQGALDDYVRLQKDRVTRFGTKAAAEPSTQIRLAESAADLDGARLSLFRNFAEITDAVAAGGEYPAELLARIDRDQVLAGRCAVAAVDRVFADVGAGALSLDTPIQRAWRDVHAGAAHPAVAAGGKLAAYGAFAFGLPPTLAH